MPVERPRRQFVVDPEDVRGHRVDRAGRDLGKLPSPRLRREAAELELTGHQDPRFSLMHQVVVSQAQAAKRWRLPAQIKATPLDRQILARNIKNLLRDAPLPSCSLRLSPPSRPSTTVDARAVLGRPSPTTNDHLAKLRAVSTRCAKPNPRDRGDLRIRCRT